MSARALTDAQDLFSDLDAESILRLVANASDIVLVLGAKGEIVDATHRDGEYESYGLRSWIGGPWRDSVAPDSVHKIDALLEDSRATPVTRRRQVNHPGRGGAPDLPVEYRVVALNDGEKRIALGDDMSRIAAIQQRFVQTQLELEAEHQRIRQDESRYRAIFHLADRPMLILRGADRKVLDANRAAATMFGKPPEKLVGSAAAGLFPRSTRDALDNALGAALRLGVQQEAQAAFGAAGFTAVISPYRQDGAIDLLVRLEPVGARSGEAPLPDSAVLNRIPQPIALLSDDGVIRATNDRFLDLIKVLTPEHAIGRSLGDWLGVSSVDSQVLLRRLGEGGEVLGFASVIRDELGHVDPVSVSATRPAPFSVPGWSDGLCLVIAEPQRLPAAPAITRRDPSGQEDFTEMVGRVPLKDLIRDSVDVIEKMCIEAALRRTNNNRASAAEILGLSRQSLYVKLKRYGLEDFGSDS